MTILIDDALVTGEVWVRQLCKNKPHAFAVAGKMAEVSGDSFTPHKPTGSYHGKPQRETLQMDDPEGQLRPEVRDAILREFAIARADQDDDAPQLGACSTCEGG
jgi:hypothetical protein